MPSSLTSTPRQALAALVGAAVLAALTLPVGPALSSVLATQAAAAPVPRAAQRASAPLRVASYNIRNANTYEHRKNEKPWTKRRGAVVAAIKGQHLDVLGVQEASQGMLHDAASRGRGSTSSRTW